MECILSPLSLSSPYSSSIEEFFKIKGKEIDSLYLNCHHLKNYDLTEQIANRLSKCCKNRH
jgi:hypothetical protein